MQFLMAVISKMAHKVDLGFAERQISQSLYSRMLHQEYAVCASVKQGAKEGVPPVDRLHAGHSKCC